MGNYLRALLRLENQPSDDEPGDGVEAPERVAVARARRNPRAYTALLDNLRALDSRLQVPSAVIAGTSSLESAHAIVVGLAARAAQQQVRLGCAELVLAVERRTLQLTNEGEDSARLELSGAPSSGSVGTWLARAGRGHDLLVIEAPSLDASIDAALLGRACDGLVLVVEPRVTTRQSLQKVLEQIRAAGCPVLGLVMNGSREWLPRWLRVFFDAYPRTIQQPKRPPRTTGK